MRIAFVERTKYYLIAELDDLICSVSGEIWTDRVFDFLDIQVSWSQYHDLPAMKYWNYKKSQRSHQQNSVPAKP